MQLALLLTLLYQSTDTNNSAGPIVNLYRNSSSPANGDYLGQIKFQGESDTGATRNYAKITGKISDVSNGNEDGILEFAFLKAGSQNINARFKSTELMLMNGTNFSVDGTSEFTGDITSNGHIDLPDEKNIRFGADGDLAIGHTSFHSFVSNRTNSLYISSSDHVYIRTTNTGGSYTPINGGNSAIDCKQNAEVALYHNNQKRFETTSQGGKITDNNTTADLQFTTITGNNGYVWADNADVIGFRDANPHWLVKCIKDGAVELYYDNVKKFETTQTGVVVSGIVTATDVDSTSDIRLKTNIQAIEDPLAKVVQIEGVSFNWKEDNRPALGVIADQVEK